MPDDFDEIERQYGAKAAAPAVEDFDAIEAQFGAKAEAPRPSVAPVRAAIYGSDDPRPVTPEQAALIFEMSGARADAEARAKKYEAKAPAPVYERDPQGPFDAYKPRRVASIPESNDPAYQEYQRVGGREGYLARERDDALLRYGVRTSGDADKLIANLRTAQAQDANRKDAAKMGGLASAAGAAWRNVTDFFGGVGEAVGRATDLVDPTIREQFGRDWARVAPSDAEREVVNANPSVAGEVVGTAATMLTMGPLFRAFAGGASGIMARVLPAAAAETAAQATTMGLFNASMSGPNEDEVEAFTRGAIMGGVGTGTGLALRAALRSANPAVRALIAESVGNAMQAKAVNPDADWTVDAAVGAILGAMSIPGDPEVRMRRALDIATKRGIPMHLALQDIYDIPAPVAPGKEGAVAPLVASDVGLPTTPELMDPTTPMIQSDAYRPTSSYPDPVEAAKATAAEFDARATEPAPVAPEPVAPPPPAPETPKAEAPTAPTRRLVGTDARGKEVYEVNGRYYVKAEGKYGVAHPDSVKEAQASAPEVKVPAPLSDEDRYAALKAKAPSERTAEEMDWAHEYYRKKESAKESEAAAKRESERAAKPVQKYVDGMTPTKKARVLETLERPRLINGAPRTHADYVESAVAGGARVVTRRDGKRAIEWPDGRFMHESDLSKTALDYAEHLASVNPETPAVEAPKAETAPEPTPPEKPVSVAPNATPEAPSEPATATTPPEPTREGLVHVGKGEYVRPGSGEPTGPAAPAAQFLGKTGGLIRGIGGAVKEAGAALFTRVRNFFSSQSLPHILRGDPLPWRALIKSTSAEQIGDVALNEYRDRVLGPLPAQDAMRFGAALVEANRLGIADARRAEAGKIRANIATAKGLLKEAAAADKAGDKDTAKAKRKEARALLAEGGTRKANNLDREAKAIEDTEANIVGPDRTFETRAEYNEFINRPDVQEAAERHRAWWDKHIEPRYKTAQGIDPSVALPGRGRGIDARINLVRPQDLPVLMDTDIKIRPGRLSNIFTFKSRFGRKAYGTSEVWELDPMKYLAHTLKWTVGNSEWKAATDRLVDSGIGVRPNMAKGEKPPKEIDGEKAVRLEVGGKHDPIYVPESLAEALRLVRKTELGAKIPIVTAILNHTTVQAMKLWGDNVFNILRAVTVPTFRPISPAHPYAEALGGFVAWPVTALYSLGRMASRLFERVTHDQALERAEAGVTRPYGDPKSNPIGTRTVARIGMTMDKVARAEMNARFDEGVKAGKWENTPENRNRFVNQMGAYNRAWYGQLERILTESGVNPFIEAWRTARGNAARTLSLSPGVKANNMRAALEAKLVVASKLFGLLTSAGIWNALNADDTYEGPMGPKDMPVGAFFLGRTPGDKKARYFDPWKFLGIRQLGNMTGILPAIQTIRGGGTMEQAAEDAVRGIANAGIGLVSGPGVQVASIATTGSRPGIGAPPVVGPSLRERMTGAALEAYPMVDIVTHYGSVLLPKSIAQFLVAGEDLTPDAVDESWRLLKTLGVNTGKTPRQVETLPERREKANLAERVDYIASFLKQRESSEWPRLLEDQLLRVDEEDRPRVRREVNKKLKYARKLLGK